VNTTPSDFDAEVTVTLDVLPKRTTPPTPASLLALMNMAFSIPPQSTFELETTCSLPIDTKLLSLKPHQHDFGKGIDAWVVGGAHDGKLIYTTDEWEDPPVATFDPPLELKAGDQLRWVCRWQN